MCRCDQPRNGAELPYPLFSESRAWNARRMVSSPSWQGQRLARVKGNKEPPLSYTHYESATTSTATATHPVRPRPSASHQRDSERTSGISLVVMTRSMTLSNLSSLMKLFAPPDPSLSPRICSTSPSTCRGGAQDKGARRLYSRPGPSQST